MQLLPMLPDSRFHLLQERLSPAQLAAFFANLRGYIVLFLFPPLAPTGGH